MNKDKPLKTLDVRIMERDFRVSCTEDEETSLLRAVDYVDRKMREIRDSGKVIGVERIAIMAALNIAHDLLSTKGPHGFELGELRRRIEAMQAAIDAAMSVQDELF
jgi:cell division protein ZapA